MGALEIFQGWDSGFNMAVIVAALFFVKGLVSFDDAVLLFGFGYLVLSDYGLGVLGNAFFN
jgi:hypothetical protein